MLICVVLDELNIVKEYGICLVDGHIPLINGVLIDTDLNLDVIELVNNYKVIDSKLEELTLEEKPNEHLQPNKIEILDKRVAKLINGQMKMEKRQQEIEESQLVQDMLIDDIVFEVIPTLEEQINVNNIEPNEIGEILLNNKNKKENGVNAMAAYLAQKIIEGRDYATVFKTKTYRQYQDEVDTILELEGRGDLIKRSYV